MIKNIVFGVLSFSKYGEVALYGVFKVFRNSPRIYRKKSNAKKIAQEHLPKKSKKDYTNSFHEVLRGLHMNL